MPYVGLVTSLSIIILGTSGVALPVPRKSATIGRATVFVNSSEKKKSFMSHFIGSIAKKTSNHLTIDNMV